MSFLDAFVFGSSHTPTASLEEEKLIPVREDSDEGSSALDSLERLSILPLLEKMLSPEVCTRPSLD